MSKTPTIPVALVTGGNSGIGKATSLAFARIGAKVVIAARRIKESEEIVDNIRNEGGEAIFVRTDVSIAEEVKQLIQTIVETYGRLDWACNNAGVEGSKSTIIECSEENWDQVIDINLKGVWLCMRYEISQMLKQGGGVIVNISSIAGFLGIAGFGPYSASKHGVIGLTKTAAREYSKYGIRINAVCPGSIYTQMIERMDGGPIDSSSYRITRTAMGRLGSPEEIASVVLWLCSDAASYVTGHSLVADGGALA